MYLDRQSDFSAWIQELGNAAYSPGCFGSPEYNIGEPMDSSSVFHVYKVNDIIIPIKTVTQHRFHIFKKEISSTIPINGLLGKPSPNTIKGLTVFFNKLMKSGQTLIHIPEQWNTILEPSLLKNRFKCIQRTCCHQLPLPSNYSVWFNTKGVYRSNIRKGIKNNLLIKQYGPEGIETFFYLYDLSMQRWKSKGKLSKKRTINEFFSLFSNGNGRYTIYTTYTEKTEKPIASALIGTIGDTASYLFGAMNTDFNHLSPAYFLQSKIIDDLIQCGKKLYIMGLSGNDRNIERFKENLGAKPIPVYVYSNGVHNYHLAWHLKPL